MSSTPESAFSDYIVFVDESGDHGMGVINPFYPIFVLAFCVFPCGRYMDDVTPSMRRLKWRLFGHDLIVLHESDIRRKAGAFAALSKSQRAILMDGLAAIVSTAPMTVIPIVIEKTAHPAMDTVTHPYRVAVRQGLELLADFLTARDQMNRCTAVIFEARGQHEDAELAADFQRVCTGENRDQEVYPFQIVIADKRVNSEGLQLADLVARPIGLKRLRPDQPNRAWSVIEPKIYLRASESRKAPRRTEGA